MKDLEQRLRELPRRGAPPEWKAAILASANAEEKSANETRAADTRWGWNRQLLALAAAWVIILTLHALTPTEVSQTPSVDIAAWKQNLQTYRAFAAELQALSEPSEKPKRATPHGAYLIRQTRILA